MLAAWFKSQTEEELAAERKKIEANKRKWLDDFAAMTKFIKGLEYVKVRVETAPAPAGVRRKDERNR